MIKYEIDAIKNREDFIRFVRERVIDEENSVDVNDYISSILSWVTDMDGYYINTRTEMPENINWSFIATLLYVGRIYE